MQFSRSVVAVALVGVLAAACGSASPTTAPGASSGGGGGGGGGGGATQQPQATGAAQPTAAGGGGGGGGGGTGTVGFDNGKVHYEVSGSVQDSGDLGFVPAGSVFNGTTGTSLSFVNNTDTATVLVSIADIEGKLTVTFTNSKFTIPGAPCTSSDLKIDATSASGSFECKTDVVVMLSGATVGAATVKGNFTAHA